MFSLKQELARWSDQLKHKGRLKEADLTELQEHLIDEFSAGKALGLDERAAFDRAVQKIGSVNELSREYAKNGTFEQMVGAVANAPWVMKLLGLLLVTGGGFHIYYSLRFFWTVPDGLSVITLGIFLVMLWSVIKGLMLLAGREGGYVGLFFFFLFQIPAIYLATGNYEITTGLAINLYFGDIDSVLGIDSGSELHINIGDVSARQYIAINLLPVCICFLMLLKIWHQGRQKEFESGAV